MKVDLNPLPFRHALELIEWCYDNDIDREKANLLMNACNAHPPISIDIDWTLDIPEKYVTYFLLRWL